MSIRVLPEAEEEFQAAADRYNAERPGLGEDFAEEVALAFETIVKNPRLHPRLGPARQGREFRSFLLHRFPFSIHYLVKPDEVVVFAIAHAKRRPNYWKRRKE